MLIINVPEAGVESVPARTPDDSSGFSPLKNVI